MPRERREMRPLNGSDAVVATIVGGLGNQLFQFAAAKAIQPDPSDPVLLDDRHKHEWPIVLQKVLRADAFRLASRRELLSLRQLPTTPAGHRTLLRLQEASRHPLINRHVVYESESSLSLRRKAILRGYFQDPRWPEARSKELLSSFLPPAPEASRLLAGLRSTGARALVGISVRAGADYQSFGVMLDRQFYLEGADLLAEFSPTFLVTGDDNARVQDVAHKLPAWAHVEVASELDAKAQMDVLAGCDHLVISNSSFAWWAAWLGDQRANNGRVVVRPEPWIAGAPTRCPTNWRALHSVQGHTWAD